MLDTMEAPGHSRQLLLQLNNQRTKGFLCDVIIVVQNALFRAHKNVLAASAGGMLTYGVYLGRWPAARPAGGLGPGPGEEARPAGSPPPLLRLRLRT